MIRHIVFFTIKDKEDIMNVSDMLRGLGLIPCIKHFEVAVNAHLDQQNNDIDIVVYAEFADINAFTEYKNHSTYKQITKKVQPRRELRFCADIYVEDVT